MPKLWVSPEISHRRSLRRMGSGGNTDVTVSGEGTPVRPGSWNRAKARDGSPEDLRDPIRVHAREPEIKGAGANKPLARKRTSTLAGALRRTRKQEGSDGLRKRIHK